MQHITAIGFDLFDTLITVETLNFQEALGRLIRGLQNQGFAVEEGTFSPVYREAARDFVKEARRDGRETHNRFWICMALHHFGYTVSPDDPRIAQAVDAYFSAFLDHAALLPETRETLAILKTRYRLGLLSNFTHGPAVKTILARLELAPLLDITLISGELGYRKPHPTVFHELTRQFGLPKDQIAFIGDDLENDVKGAQRAGLQPIWTTYVRDRKATSTTGSQPQTSNTTSPSVPTVASWNELLTLLDTA
jgi:putative hydrolase of the HAD superfamily